MRYGSPALDSVRGRSRAARSHATEGRPAGCWWARPERSSAARRVAWLLRESVPAVEPEPTRVSVVRLGSEDKGVSFGFEDTTQSMLWPETQDRRLKDPERQLLDAIAAGELDEHLVAIADAVHARRQLRQTVRSAQAIADLCVGDRVMFTNRIRPSSSDLSVGRGRLKIGDASTTLSRWPRPARSHASARRSGLRGSGPHASQSDPPSTMNGLPLRTPDRYCPHECFRDLIISGKATASATIRYLDGAGSKLRFAAGT